MKSTFGSLNTAIRGIFAQQASLDTVGHNIANANTDGYSRQNVVLSTTAPDNYFAGTGMQQIGTGVAVESVQRARDVFMDKQMWKESASLGYGQTTQDTLGKIEGVFHEPSDTGLQTVLNRFWTAWQSLATNASDDGARAAVRQRGVEMVNAITHAATQLKDMAADINSVLQIKVDHINQITAEISSLNSQISIVEVGGVAKANDLRDRRDVLVDELSKMINVSVNEDKYGNYIIQSSGVTLVDGLGCTKLATKSTVDDTFGYETKNVVLDGTNQTINFSNGEIKGLIDARDSEDIGIKGYLNHLNKVSQFLLQDFNAVHKTGFGTDGSTGKNFFDNKAIGAPDTDFENWTPPAQSGGWIAALSVNQDLFDDTNGLNMIAAKMPDKNGNNTQGNGTGDNAIALAEILKSDSYEGNKGNALGGVSLDTYYSALIGRLGVQAQDAQRLTDNQQTLVDQIENWRQSTSGVNMDEEMTNMIRFQQGYNAAARLVTTLDEMFDKLINGMGTVGR